MLYTNDDVAMVRKVAILQSTVVFLSITLFLTVGFLYIYVGSNQ